MNIALFGATGRVGKLVHQNLLDAGHSITVLARNKDKVHLHATIIEGDARDEMSISKTIQHADIIISCLSTDKSNLLCDFTPKVLKQMKKHNKNRIITVGTAGILQSREEPRILRYQSSESKRGLTKASIDHEKAWQALLLSSVDWTIVCPTYLPDGEETAIYRIEEQFLPAGGKSISTADTAHFIGNIVKQNSHIKQKVGISY